MLILLFTVRRGNFLDIDVHRPWAGITESIGSILPMVVESFNAHDDHRNDYNRNDYYTTSISQAISQPWNTRDLHVYIFNLVSETKSRTYRVANTLSKPFFQQFSNCRIHVIYYKSGIWVYPVFEVLTLPLRIVFFLVLLTFCTILYFVGETLNNLIWGNEHTKHKKSHAKSK